MFDTITTSFSKIINKLMGSSKITQADLDQTLNQIRLTLIDSDVALPVVEKFIANVVESAKGQEVIKSVSPSQMIIKIINDEMVKALQADESQQEINLIKGSLNSILMLGLQGSGKTTSCAKLALFFQKQNQKVLLISADTYRPAAREQLKILAESIGVDFFLTPSNNPIEITELGLQHAKVGKYDVAIFDTAGRLQIDQEMIKEAQKIKTICNPTEVLLVLDSLSGQNAFSVASEFNNMLNVTGSILTRIDGDAKGGAVLSVRYITGKAIKFLGVGEKVTALEAFDAKRIASRIVGMGDIVSLVETAANAISKQEAEKSAAKLQKGQFDLQDYLDQIRNLKKMGGIMNVMKMIPGMAAAQDKLNASKIDSNFTTKQEAVILSMTKKERKNPAILNTSRKNRIAKGSATSIQDVQKLIKQFEQMQIMVKKASKMNLSSLMSKTGIGSLFS